jgi:flagellin
MANIGATSALFRVETSLSRANSEVSKSMERLATGDANANAGDRSSYVAMSDTFKLDIIGTKSGIKGASVAMGYLETAMSVLDTASALLARLQELAVLGANDTNTTADHEAINIEAEAIADEFHRLLSTATYKGKDLFIATENSEVLAVGGRSQAISFGIQSIDYTSLYGNERTINHTNGPNDNLTVNLTTLPSEAVETPTQYLGTVANPILGGVKYEIVDMSGLTTWFNNMNPNTELANTSWYINRASDIGGEANVKVGATFTGVANPWSVDGVINRLKDPIGVKEFKEPLTKLIEQVQEKVNEARVAAGSQYIAIENAVSYSTDLTVQYQIGEDIVSDVNFSSETAYLAKNQILQQAATAMLVQANQGQRGLLQLVQI